ncbi:prepilin peptidase [Polynucleobacter necessarius]|uniref:prepilin peptidase n=1 Tax=Polynucleobacter necessarius TaxID=576610 RepID=UPI000E09CD80|nr:A24 family peptidase [Polynucleobacter necessarius]
MADTLFAPSQTLALLGQIGFWYALLLGLIVGSFLNVVIYHLPKVLFSEEGDIENHASIISNLKCLVHPGSTTPCCNHVIAWSDNISLLSWLRLKGRCRYCASAISPRYFLVELFTGLGFASVYLAFGLSWATPLYCLFLALLIALFFIDLETYYLPDYLTYSALALGVVGSLFGLTSVSLFNCILGACGGYLLPWSVNYLYRLFRKRDGFGGGDFKLLAVFGAWFGFSAIMPILAIASILGLLVITSLMLMRKETLSLERMLPFGPFLILAGGFILLFGIPAWFFS